MSASIRALLFWLLLAPLLFIVVAEVILLPAGLVAQLFYEPPHQPIWLQAVLFAAGVMAFVTSGALVWWCWRRFRIPDVTSARSDSAS